MKKLITAALSLAMVLGLSACGGGNAATPAPTQSGGAAEPVAIKIATGGQDTLPSYAALLDVIDDINAATGGTTDIQYFGARALGDDAEILQQVMAGTVQIGGGGASIFSTYTQLLDVLQMPFLLNSYEKERQALSSDEVQAIYDKVEETLGIKILATYDSGMRHLANNIRPITSIEDVKGLKLRVVPSDNLIASFEAIGANPSNMSYGEIYTGLQNKVIDGEEINITSIYSEKHYEVLKYFTEIGIYPFATTIYANADWFNAQDPQLQQTLLDCFDQGYDYVYDIYLPEAESAGYAAMEAAGIQIDTITDVSAFQEAVAPILEETRQIDPTVSAFIDMALALE